MDNGCGAGNFEQAGSLDPLKRCCVELGNEALAQEVDALAERVAEGRFYVACIGQFKRGKSTLLNALVGRRVLPEGVVPVTSALTVLRYGSEPSARVRLRGQPWATMELGDVRAFVSEQQNPENRRGVDVVEVFVPSALLQDGMCLVDTPGIGSSLAGNSAETWSFVPHIDAALVVLGGDPPITADELKLVAGISRSVRDYVFVMNKADRLNDQDLTEAATFVQGTLEACLARGAVKLYPVSALDRVEGRGPSRAWAEMADALRHMASSSGRRLVHEAALRGCSRLASALLREIDDSRRALLAPVEESEERVRSLHSSMAGAEQSLRDLGYLLNAEQERLYARFLEQQEMFLERARPAARQELERRIGQATDGRLALRRRGFDQAREVARAWLERWLDDEQPVAEELYRDAARRFVQLGNELLQRLVEPALWSGPPAQQLDPESGFRLRSRLYYTELMTLDPGPASWLQDLVRTRQGAREAVARDASSYMDRLLETNASRIVGDLNERVLESRRRLEMDIRRALRDAIACAQRAVERARVARARGVEAVEGEDRRLRELHRRVFDLARAPGEE